VRTDCVCTSLYVKIILNSIIVRCSLKKRMTLIVLKEGYPIEKKQLLPKRAWQRRLWLFCEEPESSIFAKVFAVFSILCIVVSIINFCTETLPRFDRPMCVNVTSDGELTFNYQVQLVVVSSI